MGGRSGYITGARGVDLQRGKVHLLFCVLEEFRDETLQMFLQAFGLSIGQRLYTISISYGARVVNDKMAQELLVASASGGKCGHGSKKCACEGI